jgi:hypothetical protein
MSSGCPRETLGGGHLGFANVRDVVPMCKKLKAPSKEALVKAGKLLVAIIGLIITEIEGVKESD